jgi:hypothetical protein
MLGAMARFGSYEVVCTRIALALSVV